MRDLVIDYIHEQALLDRDVVLLTADFGAPSLDSFRQTLPLNVIQCGIAEQNMIDMAAGMALSGKKVFCYAMAPFITARCYEQIKCSLSAMNLPVTLIGVGVGLGYDANSMTHLCVEDIAIMRVLNHMEIITPCDDVMAAAAIKMCSQQPSLRYLRLDRQPFKNQYTPREADRVLGCDEADQILGGGGVHTLRIGTDVTIVTCGAMVHTAMEVSRRLVHSTGMSVGVVDIVRLPIEGHLLGAELVNTNYVLTLDEQYINGGLGGAVVESLVDSDFRLFRDLHGFCRVGIEDGYTLVNGGRTELHKHLGIDVEGVEQQLLEMVDA